MRYTSGRYASGRIYAVRFGAVRFGADLCGTLRGVRTEHVMAHLDRLLCLDHQTPAERVDGAAAWVGCGTYTVGEPRPTKVEEKQEQRRQAHTTNQRVHRLEGSGRAVEIPINHAADQEHRELGNEETDQDKPHHRTNGLPWG